MAWRPLPTSYCTLEAEVVARVSDERQVLSELEHLTRTAGPPSWPPEVKDLPPMGVPAVVVVHVKPWWMGVQPTAVRREGPYHILEECLGRFARADAFQFEVLSYVA